MSVRTGREFLAIPGPTTVPDEVLRAMHRPAVDIYSGPLLALTDGLLRDVARVFNTTGRVYIYMANGHGAWEAALTNVLSPGDKILVLESGRFAAGWGEHARRIGLEVEVRKGSMRRVVRPAEVEACLKADKGRAMKAVLMVQIDTASGVVNDIAALGQALDLLFEEGLDNVFRRHRLLAEAVRRAVGVCAEGQVLDFNIIAPQKCCDTVTAVLMNGGHDPEALRAYCNKKGGVIVGHGIGELSGKAIRIAHMGYVSAPMVLGTLSVIEVGLAALGIPHGRGGVQAAIDWLGAEVKGWAKGTALSALSQVALCAFAGDNVRRLECPAGGAYE